MFAKKIRLPYLLSINFACKILVITSKESDLHLNLWKYMKESEYRYNRRGKPNAIFSDLVGSLGLLPPPESIEPLVVNEGRCVSLFLVVPSYTSQI